MKTKKKSVYGKGFIGKIDEQKTNKNRDTLKNKRKEQENWRLREERVVEHKENDFDFEEILNQKNCSTRSSITTLL